MLRHGITTFVEPGSAFEPDAVAAATQEVGIRCTLAEPYLWDTTEIMDAIPGLASPALFARVPPERDRCLKLLGSQLFRNRDKDGITARPRRALRRGHGIGRALSSPPRRWPIARA